MANTIFVDLDGTLVRTDLFIECIFQMAKRHPLKLFLLPLWLIKGRAYAKERVMSAGQISPEILPYEEDLLAYLKEKKKEGSRLFLATASHEVVAQEVSDHLGIFDGVIATKHSTNNKGVRKLDAIRKLIGESEFAYAGNSTADRVIWSAASSNILVNAPAKDISSAESRGVADLVINSRVPILRALANAMRPHQYAKNILVFVPLFTSHTYLDSSALALVALAFLCFCLCASGVYFVNDIFDLESDRRHVLKKNRPLASGDLPLHMGIIGALLFSLIAFWIAYAFLPVPFMFIIAIYIAISTCYSLLIKSTTISDVVTLSVLYTLRVVAGAAAISVMVSSWLLGFSVFLFLSLAYLKRFIEIVSLPEGVTSLHGRGYTIADKESLFSLGTASLTASVLILALYINSSNVMTLYQSPNILWLLCLIVLYWGHYVWISARRGKVHDDPIAFALKDSVSRACALAMFLTVVSARNIGG